MPFTERSSLGRLKCTSILEKGPQTLERFSSVQRLKRV